MDKNSFLVEHCRSNSFCSSRGIKIPKWQVSGRMSAATYKSNFSFNASGPHSGAVEHESKMRRDR